MRRIRQGVLAVMTTALLAVTLAPGAGAQSPAPNALSGTDWLLASVGTSPVASGINADLLFADENAGGFGGCNRFVASYTTDGVSTLVFGEIASTMMACDEATTTFEQSYVTALGTVASYAITDTGLDLSDAAGAVVLSYGATAPASVEGPWNVRSVNNGKDAVSTLPEGIGASVAFGPDGTVEGFGGCNSFSGGYSVDGDSIAIGPLMSTMMSCGEEADTVEQQLLTALQAATTWSVTSGILELRDDAGALQVDATSAIGH
jgi:heat shock protein HslJ